MAKKSSPKLQDKQTVHWIENQPGLVEQLQRLREIGQNSAPGLDRLEKTEQQVLAEIYKIGAGNVGQWLQEKEQHASNQAKFITCLASNCGGINFIPNEF